MNKDEAFILKRTAKNFSIVERGVKTNCCYSTEMPLIVGVKLTNRCNLRCKTCYEWNEQGYHHGLSDELKCKELDIDIFRKVIQETEKTKSNIYLWGGEPLTHTRFDDIANIMESANRISAICTNATLIDRHIDNLCKFSRYQELLIALDGLEKENDEIRGKGTFEKVVTNVRTLLDLRKKGEYFGKISIHSVITADMVDKIPFFLELMEDVGVDSVILCYPWYISAKNSVEMDSYYKKHTGGNVPECASWHAFKFSYPENEVERLIDVRRRILQREWSMPVKFQPNLKEHMIRNFVLDEEERSNDYRCYSICDRMEILPDGTVSSCKHFPEFAVGNLYESSVKEIWTNEKYCNVRQVLSQGLMPVCTKCNNLYLHGRRKENA